MRIGGGTIFKEGWARILEVKNGASASAVALARRRRVSEVGAFLKMWAQLKRFDALFFIMLNI